MSHSRRHSPYPPPVRLPMSESVSVPQITISDVEPFHLVSGSAPVSPSFFNAQLYPSPVSPSLTDAFSRLMNNTQMPDSDMGMDITPPFLPLDQQIPIPTTTPLRDPYNLLQPPQMRRSISLNYDSSSSSGPSTLSVDSLFRDLLNNTNSQQGGLAFSDAYSSFGGSDASGSEWDFDATLGTPIRDFKFDGSAPTSPMMGAGFMFPAAANSPGSSSTSIGMQGEAFPSNSSLQVPGGRQKRTFSMPDINYQTPSDDTNRMRYRCDFEGCGREFNHRSNFLEHRRTHTGERPFKCDYPDCSLTYTTRNRLNIHQRKHTGEKPFPCDYPNCEFATTQSSNLKKHKRTHLTAEEKAAAEADKQVECSICGKRYGNQRGYKHHLITIHKISQQQQTT
ncbi:hypothetical protein HDU78_004965 [Chytriomyces hyalinus]|nr:hypothetical protein HDU78_004965 [Chytriomyces hyalinus]